MILTMIYKTGQIRSISNIVEVNSRKNHGNSDFTLIAVNEGGDEFGTPIPELDRWILNTEMGTTLMNIGLKDPAVNAG